MAYSSNNYTNDTPSKISTRIFDPEDKEIFDRIDKRIKRYYNYNRANIERFRSDRLFLFVDQWMQSEREGFAALNKPIFTYNKLYDYYRKLVGEQRFNTSNLEVRTKNINNVNIPQKEVTLRADIIRGIEYQSKAEIAYQTAFANAVSGGMGFIRLRTDYVSPNSFNQDIYIEPEKFSDRVFYDPLSTKPTKTDGNFIGRYEQLDRDVFEQEYPDIPYPQSFPTAANVEFFTWGNENSITVCEYYEKEWFNFTLYQLSNGECISKKEYNKRKKAYEDSIASPPAEDTMTPDQNNYEQAMEAQIAQMQQPVQPPSGTPEMNQANPEQPQMPQAPMQPQAPQTPPLMAGVDVLPEIVSKRRARDYKIICYKSIFGYIIDRYEWPGKEFPIAAVMGGEEVIKGETIITSLTTYARDPQRFFNFLVSDLAQAAKNNRREQFLVTADNIAGYEQYWKNPGNQLGGLLYNPDGITKEKPERLPTPELPQTLLLNLQQADKDMRSILGYPQENEGRQFGQLSGKAIREMQRAGNSSNLIFFDNLKCAQEQIGRAILSMMPKVYDTERTLLAHGIDGKSREVTVNKKVAGGMMNDLSKGDFDVTVNAGANYAVQREEALQVLMQLIQVLPNSGNLVADIIAKNVDIEDNIELVNRFKTLVPPDVIAQADGKPMPPQPPNPQQQMMAKQQQLEEAKLQLEQVRIQVQQQEVQSKRELNMVKHQQAMVDMEIEKMKGFAEMQKAGFDYRAQIADSEAKIAAAHASATNKHLEVIKHVHDTHHAEMKTVNNQQAQ